MSVKYIFIISFMCFHCGWVSPESCAVITDVLNKYLLENNLTQYHITEVKNKFDLDECLCEEKCLRKCCAVGYSFSETRKMCVLDEYNTYYFEQYNALFNTRNKYDYVPGIECIDFYYQDPFKNSKDNFVILENGSMHLVAHDVFISSSEYCLEYFENKGICGIVCFPSVVEESLTSKLKPLDLSGVWAIVIAYMMEDTASFRYKFIAFDPRSGENSPNNHYHVIAKIEEMSLFYVACVQRNHKI